MAALDWGIDLGGTKIEGVVVADSDVHKPVARIRIDTEQELGYEHVLSRIASLIEALAQSAGTRPSAVGLSHPGTLDPKHSVIKNSNTQCLNSKPLQRDLEHLLGTRLALANDANCFALAESCWGAAVGAEVVFGVIMGTGVGGGIVVNGRVHSGHQGIAGEWGHTTLLSDGAACYCGRSGCVETVISGPALERFYSTLSGKELPLSAIFDSTNDADSSVLATRQRLYSNFGRALGTVINILDPSCVVLGGGLSNISGLYSEGLAELQANVFNSILETRIVRNKLGDSAGVFGAALLARSYIFST